jgi:hypothetical protein
MIDIPETIRYIQATHSGIGVTADGRAADEDNPRMAAPWVGCMLRQRRKGKPRLQSHRRQL